ncbi:MAG: hypothetical protein HY304_04420 [candidate division Zixibacteria bacterium]|nr:hypothetical protein [candidate division Zixibacteria bacterium]
MAIACVCLFVLTDLGFSGCGLESPQSPHWTVTLAVPLASRRIDTEYIARHAGIDALTWQADSGLAVYIKAPLDTVRLAGHLTLEDGTRTSQVTLGDFTLGIGLQSESTLPLSDLYSGPSGFVAAFSGEANHELPPVTTFDSIDVISGTVRVDVQNQTGLSLDSLQIVLRNVGSPAAFATVAIPGPLQSGDAAHGTAPMVGTVLTPNWEFELHFHTPGGTILTAADKRLVVAASLPEGVRASRARGAIDPILSVRSDTITFGGHHLLQGAEFRRGQIAINWTNHSALPLTLAWTLPDVVSGGEPISGSSTVEPYGSTHATAELEGALYQASIGPSALRFDVTASSPGSGGQIVNVAAGDDVGYDLGWSGVELTSLHGSVGQTTVSTGVQSAHINWENGLDSAGLDDWGLTLQVTSSIGLSATMSGRLRTNTGLDLPVNGTISAATTGQPTVTDIAIPHGIAPLHPLPSSMTVDAQITFGGSPTSVTLGAGDYFALTGIASAGPNLYLDGVTLNGTPEMIDLNSQDYRDRTGRLAGARITIVVSNRFPLGGTFAIRLAADSGSVDTAPTLEFGPVTLASAATDGSGHAVAPVTSTFEFEVAEDKIALFEHERIWANETITLLGPGQGQPARISLDDEMQWTAAARLDLKMGDGSTM